MRKMPRNGTCRKIASSASTAQIIRLPNIGLHQRPQRQAHVLGDRILAQPTVNVERSMGGNWWTILHASDLRPMIVALRLKVDRRRLESTRSSHSVDLSMQLGFLGQTERTFLSRLRQGHLRLLQQVPTGRCERQLIEDGTPISFGPIPRNSAQRLALCRWGLNRTCELIADATAHTCQSAVSWRACYGDSV